MMASAPGIHAQLLHNMCQRRYWDTLDIRQYLTRIDTSSRLRLEPSEGAGSACLALSAVTDAAAIIVMHQLASQANVTDVTANLIHESAGCLVCSDCAEF